MGNAHSGVHSIREDDGLTGHMSNQDSEPASAGTYQEEEEEGDYGNYISAEEDSFCREEENIYYGDGNLVQKDSVINNPYEDDPLPDTLCKFQNFSLKSCTSLSDSPAKGSSFVDTSDMHENHQLESAKKRKRTLKSLSLSYATDRKYTKEELLMFDGDLPTDETDMKPRIIKTALSISGTEETTVKCRSFHVVTTASLPWMTGTSINPLLRAVYLNQMNRHFVEGALKDVPASLVYSAMGVVTLVIPWLVSPEDQSFLYGGQFFSTQHDQEQYIRSWIRETAGLPLEADESTGGIRIRFYPAYFDYDLNSIFPTKNIYEELAKKEKIQGDICILDEPEHLGYLHFDAKGMRSNFVHVIGIMHTNYVEYMKQYPQTVLLVPFTYFVNCITTRCYCDRIIKLSDALQSYAVEKECVSNVHGIRSDFIEKGKERALRIEKGIGILNVSSDKSGIYYIGKLLWAKGFDRLIHLESAFKKATGEYFQIDIFGSGAQEKDIKRAFHGRRSLSTDSLSASDSIQDRMENLIDTIPRSRYEFRKQALPADFLGRQDHAKIGSQYKIFVNPSVSEVLCTTTAEAIAMGSFVIIPKHPSNDFFTQFPNCLTYKTNAEFVSHLKYALQNNPKALSFDHQRLLTWEAATERLIEAGMISRREQRRRERVDQIGSDEKVIEFTNNSVFDAIRDKVMSKSWVENEKNRT